jgi:hypothetical protein
MKDQNQNLMLWQKRNELRIDDDVQQDWLNMQAMLGEHMPVAPNTGISGGSAYLSGFKLLTALIIAAAAAVVLYYVFVKGNPKNNTHKKTDSTIVIDNNSKAYHSGSTDSGSSYTNSLGNNGSSQNSSGNAAANTNSKDNAPTTGNSPVMNSASRGGANLSGTANGAKDVGTVKNHNRNSNTVSHGNAVTANSNSLSAKVNSRAANAKKAIPGNRINGDHLSLNNAAGNNGRNYFAIPNNRLKNENAVGTHARSLRNSIAVGNLSNINSSRHPSPGSGRHRSGKDNKGSKTVKDKINRYADNRHDALTNPAINNDKSRKDTDVLMPQIPQFMAEPYAITVLSTSIADKYKTAPDTSSSPNKKTKPVKTPGGSKFDYGILAGVNAGGSFTAQNENKNFYGSFPVDLFFGAFATYHLSDKWGINLQLRGLNPQNISGTYTHKNDSKKDTNQVLTMTDSRKIYTADAALHLVFKPAAGWSLKAGPVFGYAFKEANGNTAFQTGPLKKDSAYYVSVVKLINATTYTRGLTMGLSAGASYQYGRFIFDAAYMRNFSGVTVGSTLGSYSANTGSFLFTIGFKLNRLKK